MGYNKQASHALCIVLLLAAGVSDFVTGSFAYSEAPVSAASRNSEALVLPDRFETPFQTLSTTETWIDDFKKDVVRSISRAASEIEGGEAPDGVLQSLEARLNHNKQILASTNGLTALLLRQEQKMGQQIKAVENEIAEQNIDSSVKQQYVDTLGIARKGLESYRLCLANADILAKKVDSALFSVAKWKLFYTSTAGITGSEVVGRKLVAMIVKTGEEWSDVRVENEKVALENQDNLLSNLKFQLDMISKCKTEKTSLAKVDENLAALREVQRKFMNQANDRSFALAVRTRAREIAWETEMNIARLEEVRGSLKKTTLDEPVHTGVGTNVSEVFDSVGVCAPPDVPTNSVNLREEWGFGAGFWQGLWGPVILVPALHPGAILSSGQDTWLSETWPKWSRNTPSWGNPTLKGYGIGYLIGLFIGPLLFFVLRKWGKILEAWFHLMGIAWILWFIFIIIPLLFARTPP
jgi:hypothetical protein